MVLQQRRQPTLHFFRNIHFLKPLFLGAGGIHVHLGCDKAFPGPSAAGGVDGLTLELGNDDQIPVRLESRGKSPLHFLSYMFRYDRDLKGRGDRYLNAAPSKKALEAEKEALQSMINRDRSHVPVQELIEDVNRQLRGWAGYFSFGYLRKVMRMTNWYVCSRLTKHLRRRSQRPFHPPKGRSYYQHLKLLGLMYL